MLAYGEKLFGSHTNCFTATFLERIVFVIDTTVCNIDDYRDIFFWLLIHETGKKCIISIIIRTFSPPITEAWKRKEIYIYNYRDVFSNYWCMRKASIPSLLSARAWSSELNRPYGVVLVGPGQRDCVVSFSDWRGAGFSSEGAHRPNQIPAGATGARSGRLRHGEPAHGLQQPGRVRLP